ncbi:MAG: hypothetical protein AAF252_10130 [Pseudomonadota bacterium]
MRFEKTRWWIADRLEDLADWICAVEIDREETSEFVSRAMQSFDGEMRIADLEAALLPFAEVSDITCRCPQCSRQSLELITTKGKIILQAADFHYARSVLDREKFDVPKVRQNG